MKYIKDFIYKFFWGVTCVVYLTVALFALFAGIAYRYVARKVSSLFRRKSND